MTFEIMEARWSGFKMMLWTMREEVGITLEYVLQMMDKLSYVCNGIQIHKRSTIKLYSRKKSVSL